MSKLQLAFKERRLDDRKQLTGLLPGKLRIVASQKLLSCRPVDVSINGMGILVSEQLDPETELILETVNGSIQMKIAWGQPDFGKKDLYRYGLVALDPKDNIQALFEVTGCLR